MTLIEIVEVGPRDGLQNEATILGVPARAEFVRRLRSAGLRRIEVGSFVNPRRVPQMADTEAVMQSLPRIPGSTSVGLVLNRRGCERALACGIDEVNAVVVATESFSQRNQGFTIAEAIETWLDISEMARSRGLTTSVTIAAAFGCPFEGRVSEERVVDIARRVSSGHPSEIAIADTIGVAVPSQVTRVVGAVHEALPRTPIRAHFHNTRNTGYANALAAIGAGAKALDASAGGIGGCPFAPQATGNIATEDLAWILTEMGYEIDLDLAALIETSRWLGEQLGVTVPATQGRVPPFPATDWAE